MRKACKAACGNAWGRVPGVNIREYACAGLRETWEDGRAFKELAQRRADVADAKEGIETARKVSALPVTAPLRRTPHICPGAFKVEQP